MTLPWMRRRSSTVARLGALKEETIMAGYPGSETERRAPAAALSLLVTEIFER